MTKWRPKLIKVYVNASGVAVKVYQPPRRGARLTASPKRKFKYY